MSSTQPAHSAITEATFVTANEVENTLNNHKVVAMASATSEGILYVVATPIGNLGDITTRAAQCLAQANTVLCEDTRVTAKLLQHLGLHKPLLALHNFNEHAISDKLVARLLAGEKLALVSDAGTPLISDPGFMLVRAARQAGVKVEPIPGCCALITALCVSGLAVERFCFEGFLPSKRGERRTALAQYLHESRTVIVYESCHRIVDSLTDCMEVLGGQRQICIAREITKRFEQIVTLSLVEAVNWIQADDNRQRGEFVLIIEGAPAQAVCTDIVTVSVDVLLNKLRQHLPVKQVAQLAAELTGQKKNALYQQMITQGVEDV